MKRRFDRKFDEDVDNLFFTSDTHFSHENIIRLTNRPCTSVEEMDEMLINNWNSVCDGNSIVYHLGDFIFGNQSRLNAIISQLNFGELHLIMGNHDMKNISFESDHLFDSVSYQKELKIGNRQVILNHNPFLCYGGTYRTKETQVWQLFGHVHTLKHQQSNGLDVPRLEILFPTQYDVGVDNNDWKPINWKDVKSKIEEQVRIYYEKNEG